MTPGPGQRARPGRAPSPRSLSEGELRRGAARPPGASEAAARPAATPSPGSPVPFWPPHRVLCAKSALARGLRRAGSPARPPNIGAVAHAHRGRAATGARPPGSHVGAARQTRAEASSPNAASTKTTTNVLSEDRWHPRVRCRAKLAPLAPMRLTGAEGPEPVPPAGCGHSKPTISRRKQRQWLTHDRRSPRSKHHFQRELPNDPRSGLRAAPGRPPDGPPT